MFKNTLSKCILFLICFVQCYASAYEHDLAICCIFKDCTPYLKEWIEFHRLVGVDHFYLYDNSSTDNPMDVLDEYVEKGIVSYIYWPNKDEEKWGDQAWAWVFSTQLPAYYHAKNLTIGKVKWLAYIDSDEFIVPVVDKNIKHLLKRNYKKDALEIFWQVYGTSHVYDIPQNKLMIELLTLKCPPRDNINLHTKIIVRPEYFVKFTHPPHKGIYSRNGVYSTIIDEIRINHYINRTEKFFYEHKIKNKEVMDNMTWNENYIKAWANLGNDIEDRIMDKYIPKLKKRMGFK